MVVRMERTSAGPLLGDDEGGVERLFRIVGRSSGRRGLGRTRWMRRLYDGMNSTNVPSSISFKPHLTRSLTHARVVE